MEEGQSWDPLGVCCVGSALRKTSHCSLLALRGLPASRANRGIDSALCPSFLPLPRPLQLSVEEKARRLAEMTAAAQEHEEQRGARLREAEERERAEGE